MSPLALLEIAVRELRHGNRELLRLVWRDLFRRHGQNTRRPDAHLSAAVEWLCRAQDATGSGGVARSYCLAWNSYFRTRGWLPAYPETTGYIIPTLFDVATRAADQTLRRRALNMADWEISVQLPTGAVQGGVIGMEPTPAVFNTGQVIFGWLRSAQETGDDRYLHAAERAGRFLVEHQDEDGVWRRGASRYAKPGTQTYNTRTAWALLELAAYTGHAGFRDAAIKNLDAALLRQLPNGWLAENCLDDDASPLTHTIAYAAQGLLEAGRLLHSERYVAAAKLVADALAARQRADGSLAGRYDARWRPVVRWSCLTGNAQVAIIWLRLAQLLSEPRYAQAADRSIQFLSSVQDLRTPDDGVRGGIAGAFPIWGDYGRLEYLNWAVKFFADALIAREEVREARAAVAASRSMGPRGSPAPHGESTVPCVRG